MLRVILLTGLWLAGGAGPSPAVAIVLSDGVLEVKHDGVRRRMGVRGGDVCWFAARTSLTVVSDHPVGVALVQIDPARPRTTPATVHPAGAGLAGSH